MSSPSSNIDKVKAMYAAFGRGDIPAVLSELHPEIHWGLNADPSLPGAAAIPLFRPFRGPAEVAQFFLLISRDLEFHAFEPDGFTAGATDVIAHVSLEFTVRPTGVRRQVESLHQFTFDSAGRVTRFREFTDTLSFATAWGSVKLA